MDAELIYSIVGIGILALIIYKTLKNDDTAQLQTKEEKQYEIMGMYRKELKEALDTLDDDRLKTAKKKELLLKFSNELNLNIFFDETDAKEMILELSQEF